MLVAALGERGLVAGLLELAPNRAPNVVGRLHGLVGREQRRVHGRLGDGLEDPLDDRPVDPNAADPDAEPGPDMRVVASALVAVRMAAPHAVEHPHHPSAAAAPREAGEQRATAAAGLAGRPPLHVGVLEQHALVLLEPLPVDVALVVVADEDVPLGHRLVVAGGLHGAAVDDARPLAAAAERVGAGVERVVQHLHDAVVGRLAPLDAADGAVALGRRAAAGRRRATHRKTCRALPSSRNFANTSRMASLHPLVRIELDAPVLAPDQSPAAA